MANVRLVFDNRYDAATLVVPDAYPAMYAEATQQGGRLAKTRLKQIKSAINPTSGTATFPLMSPTAASISCWLYRTSTMTNSLGKLAAINGSNNKYLSLEAASNVVQGDFYNGTSTSSTGTSAITLNDWTHVGVTWETGGLVRLYVDGSQTFTVDPSSDESISGTGHTAITSSLAASAGRLARTRVDLRALDASEMAALAGHRYASDHALLERWLYEDNLTGERGYALTGGTATYTTGPDAHGTTNYVQIKGTWASNQTLNCFVLLRTNLTSSATLRLRVYSDTGYTTSIYDSGTIAAQISGARTGNYTNVAFYFNQVTTARSFQLEINNGTTAVDITRIVAGAYWSPGLNVEFGLALSWRDTGQAQRTEGGAIVSEVGEIYRRLALRFGKITGSERATVSNLLYSVGGTRELFVSVFPADGGAAINSQREIDYSLVGIANTPEVALPLWENYTLDLMVNET